MRRLYLFFVIVALTIVGAAWVGYVLARRWLVNEIINKYDLAGQYGEDQARRALSFFGMVDLWRIYQSDQLWTP